MPLLAPAMEVETKKEQPMKQEEQTQQQQQPVNADLVSAEESGLLSIVVLGASGDLAKKKTFPALFNLHYHGFLRSEQVQIIGYARSKLTTGDLHEKLRGSLKPPKDAPDALDNFLKVVSYVSGPYEGRDGYSLLQEQMVKFESQTSGEEKKGEEKKEAGQEGQTAESSMTSGGSAGVPTRRLFYLALPPSVYPLVCRELHTYCMNARGWTRVIVEKPFGRDLASSEELSEQLGALFTEEQLYRIDHYLGKELVQNMLVMRFSNRFFLPLWNREHIDNVQIVFREDFGTQGRGGYFDEYGIIRDIIQNHLMQVLCLVTMERPVSNDPEYIRDEKVKVINCMEPIRSEEVVLGQYQGYLDDETVPKGSKCPTFACVVLRINNERWHGVPFIIKAGKALNSRKAEIRVQFRETPADIFQFNSIGRNEFVVRLQPSEAMYLKMTVKKPGLELAATQSELDLSYKDRYNGVNIPEAYERLILDTIRGDQQHFVRRDELKASWKLFTPLLHRIDRGEFPPIIYEQGSRGPGEADELAERVGYERTHGYVWIPPSLEG